jgi:hypothetical protein
MLHLKTRATWLSAWPPRTPSVPRCSLIPPSPIGLLLACLIACTLAGCSATPTKPGPAVVTTIIPPTAYLQPCPWPPVPGRTNGDLDAYVDALEEALDACNTSKSQIRAWAAENLKVR